MTKIALETLRSEIVKQLLEQGRGVHTGAYSNALANAIEIVQHEFADFLASFEIARPSGNTITITLVDANIKTGEVHMDAQFMPRPEEAQPLSPAQNLANDVIAFIINTQPNFDHPVSPGPRREQYCSNARQDRARNGYDKNRKTNCDRSEGCHPRDDGGCQVWTRGQMRPARGEGYAAINGFSGENDKCRHVGAKQCIGIRGHT